jgi:photosystem II stability/assembly factor-like uncharacterized protein
LPLSFVAVALATHGGAAAAEKQTWVPISASVLAKVKPGYPGKTAGVTVDPATGDVYLVVPDQGLWKSTDHGETFARIDGGKVGGRCETGFALDFDPAGKRLACFMIYGSSAWTLDAGKTWTATKSSHLDFGAVDWAESAKCLLALRHEAGGRLTLSADAGKTWKDLDKSFTHLGLFDSKTLLASRGRGILRSDDGGTTWTSVSEITPAGSVMRVYYDNTGTVGYWTSAKGLLVSKDRGRSWTIADKPAGDAKPSAGIVGPLFGKSADEMVIVAKDGIHESTDGGKTWARVAPLPEGFSVGGVGPNYAWDPVGGYFYASSMGKETYRYQR